MTSTRSEKLNDISTRICMNIPSECQWCWDEMFNTALVVFDKCDMDVIYFPITQEFDAQWDFTTIGKAPPNFTAYFNRIFGIVPGQKIFTAAEATGTILFAVWWPWGDGIKISLRVGLFEDDETSPPDHLRDLLCRWFHIQEQTSDT